MDLRLFGWSHTRAAAARRLSASGLLLLLAPALTLAAFASTPAEPATTPAAVETETAATSPESTEAAPAPQAYAGLEGRWGDILGADAVDPVQTGPVSAFRDRQPAAGFRELVDQFFFRLSVDYTHNWTTFTGDPTLTFLGDLGEPFVISPDGETISFPSAFEDNDDRLYTRLTFGTRGWGSDRLNTYVSLLSYHDLDGTSEGSPFIAPTDSYDGRSRFSALNAYFDVNGLAADGFLSDVNLRVGRQYVHSYTNELYTLGAVAMDGATFNYDSDRYRFGVYAGSRSGIFSSPENRLVTGGSFGAALGEGAYFNYDILYYSGAVLQSFTIEPVFESPLRVQGFFRMVEEHPVDVGVRVNYYGDRWGVNANVTDRVSDDDFRYDIWINSRATNAFNRVPRLYFNATQPSFRLNLDGYRQLSSWLTVGGRLWLYQLHDEQDQEGFEASFQDWSGNVAITPGDHWEVIGEYHWRDVDRGSTFDSTEFADIEFAGETNYQEFVGSVGYRFSNRLRASVGTYYRLFDLQNRLFLVDDSKTNGVFANVFLKVTRNVDFRVLYGSDNDYAVFNPDIERQSGVRIGFDFHK